MGTFGAVKGQEPGNKGGKYPAEPLTPEEVTAIISECSLKSRTGIRNRAILVLLYRSGLRISEALALKPGDIVPVKKDSKCSIGIRVLHGKGNLASTRGLHPDAEVVLQRWLDTRKTLALRNGPLFCTLDGGRLSDRYVRNLIHRLAERAGIDKRVHPHAFRHTYAVQLEQAGTPVTLISKLLGHSSVAVTHRYLDHLTNEQAVSALAAVELPPVG